MTKTSWRFAKNWLEEEQKEKLKDSRNVYVQDNVFMVVTPLVSGHDQTDIEMLFDKEVQEIEIDGRKLDKTGNKNKDKFF